MTADEIEVEAPNSLIREEEEDPSIVEGGGRDDNDTYVENVNDNGGVPQQKTWYSKTIGKVAILFLAVFALFFLTGWGSGYGIAEKVHSNKAAAAAVSSAKNGAFETYDTPMAAKAAKASNESKTSKSTSTKSSKERTCCSTPEDDECCGPTGFCIGPGQCFDPGPGPTCCSTPQDDECCGPTGFCILPGQCFDPGPGPTCCIAGPDDDECCAPNETCVGPGTCGADVDPCLIIPELCENGPVGPVGAQSQSYPPNTWWGNKAGSWNSEWPWQFQPEN